MINFFKKFEKKWIKITKLIGINNAPDFVQNKLFHKEYVKINILRNTDFVKNNCHKDEIIIVLHSVVSNNLKASLLELIEYDA